MKPNPFILLAFALCLILPFALADPYTSGGTITYDGNFTIETFTANDTFTINETIYNASVLVVAGGGAGGAPNGGGGGGGGVIYASGYNINSSIPVIVGSGGVGCECAIRNNGTDSVFNNLIAIGGGGGAASSGIYEGADGGSGGGSCYLAYGGNGVSGQGYNGGNSLSAGGNYFAGGGGAGQIGGDAAANCAGRGGNGVNINIAADGPHNYSGGGGGGAYGEPCIGLGGDGGGAKGGHAGVHHDADYYGGGGGGYGDSSTGSVAGNGYQGIVIIRYLTAGYPAPQSINISIKTPLNLSYCAASFPYNQTIDYVVQGDFSSCWLDIYDADWDYNATLPNCENTSVLLPNSTTYILDVFGNNSDNIITDARAVFHIWLSNFSCSHYTCLSSNISRCDSVVDSVCHGAIAYPGNLSDFDIACLYVPTPDFLGGGGGISDNAIVLIILVFFWLVLLTLTLIFRNFAIASLMFFIGVGLGYYLAHVSFALGGVVLIFDILIFAGLGRLRN